MILERIVATTRELTARRKGERPFAVLERLAALQPRPRDFAAALRVHTDKSTVTLSEATGLPDRREDAPRGDFASLDARRDSEVAALPAAMPVDSAGPPRRAGISVIAEIKRASPSKGVLRADLDPARFATTYAANGAAAISVITEPAYFQGGLADLAAVRAAVDLPLLRKDFIVDPYQIYEARAHGADAFLLIVAALDHAALAGLIAAGRELAMAALVEVHDEAEVAIALASGATVIGVNNRNLADFSVDLATTPRLRRFIPAGIPVVAESGIHSAADVAMLAAAGVDAVLIGEALVTSPDPGARLRDLLGGG